MKYKIIIFWTVAISAVLLLSSCIFIEGDDSTSLLDNFDFNLQGTWVSNDTSKYSGVLTITYNKITIEGYKESQTQQGDNVAHHPFKNFTKGTQLSGYSKEGNFYIEDKGEWQTGIPYIYYESGGIIDKDKFLCFNFGGRDEVLKKN